jgi:hypothetical protein
MSNINRRLNLLKRVLNSDKLAQVAFDKFYDMTPENKGYAKSQTKKRGKSIVADYNYATVLDKGRHMTNRGMRGSNQAPQGMTKPTIEEIRKYVFNKTGIKL